MDLCFPHGRYLSDEAELHVRGHRHGQALGVQQVRGHALRLQPHLVVSAGEAKHPRLDGGAVPARAEDTGHFFSEPEHNFHSIWHLNPERTWDPWCLAECGS